MRGGREANLIVDNDVDRAAGLVPFQIGQSETFGDHALARKGRIAV